MAKRADPIDTGTPRDSWLPPGEHEVVSMGVEFASRAKGGRTPDQQVVKFVFQNEARASLVMYTSERAANERASGYRAVVDLGLDWCDDVGVYVNARTHRGDAYRRGKPKRTR